MYNVWKIWKNAQRCVKCANCVKMCKICQVCKICLNSVKCVIYVQGAPKKMHHSDLYPISVLEVGFYFFTCVLDSEFWARFIWTFKQCPFWILIALERQKNMSGFLFQPNKVKLELCHLCIISPNTIWFGRHRNPRITLWILEGV